MEVQVVLTLEDKSMTTSGQALLYLEKDSTSLSLKYGDRLLIKNKWQIVEPSTNPAQFDYKNYLSNSGIYHQSYLPSSDWKHLGSLEVFSIIKIAFLWQKRLLKVLEKYNYNDQELAVASALILGYKDK